MTDYQTFRVIAEYIWLDSNNKYRSKTRVFNYGDINESKLHFADSYPEWNYDGSSCGDNLGLDSITECVLRPHTVYIDPINISTSSTKYRYVLCRNYYYDIEYMSDLNTMETNELEFISDFSERKFKLVPIHPDMEPEVWENEDFRSEEFMLGFEQEFFLIDDSTKMPMGFYRPVTYCPFTFIIVQIFRHLGISSGYLPISGNQGPYYCGVGNMNVKRRNFLTYVQSLLLQANIDITGFNYEVAPGQAEFQVFGPAIRACNDLLMTRYILQVVAEKYEFSISFEPVVINKKHGNFNMSGCHTNISFNSYRNLVFDTLSSSNDNNTDTSDTHSTDTSNSDKIETQITDSLDTTETNDTTEPNRELSNTYINDKNSTFKTVQSFMDYIKELWDDDILINSNNDFESIFGKNNKIRCHGELETSDWTEFTWGVGSRNTSVRVPVDSLLSNSGDYINPAKMYFEDRRPGSNVEPFTILRYWSELVNVIFHNDSGTQSPVNNEGDSEQENTSSGYLNMGYFSSMIGLKKTN